VQLQFLNDPEE